MLKSTSDASVISNGQLRWHHGLGMTRSLAKVAVLAVAQAVFVMPAVGVPNPLEEGPLSSLTAGRHDPLGVRCVLTSTPSRIAVHYAIIGCFGGGWEGELVVEVASDHDASVKGYADRMYGGLNITSRRVPDAVAKEFQRALVNAIEMAEVLEFDQFVESGTHVALVSYACASYARGPIRFASYASRPNALVSEPRYLRAQGLESTANDILDYLAGELVSDICPEGQLYCREGRCANRERIGEFWSP